MNKKCQFNNSGFTLVEILVVTIIVAILTAIVIPTFMDYIGKDSEEDVKEKTKMLLDASQIVFYEMYSEDQDNGDYRCVIAGAESSDSSNFHFYGTNNLKLDCDIHLNSGVTNKIYELSGIDLSTNKYGGLFIVCLGRADVYMDPLSEYYDPVKAYTVHMVMFQPLDNHKICFLTSDGVYSERSPLDSTISGYGQRGKKNDKIWVNGIEKNVDYLLIDGEKIYIQYYALKLKQNNNITFDGNQVWQNIIYKAYNQ